MLLPLPYGLACTACFFLLAAEGRSCPLRPSFYPPEEMYMFALFPPRSCVNLCRLPPSGIDRQDRPFRSRQPHPSQERIRRGAGSVNLAGANKKYSATGTFSGPYCPVSVSWPMLKKPETTF
jgi:hypothetical protein